MREICLVEVGVQFLPYWIDQVCFTADNCSFSFRTFGESTDAGWSNALEPIVDAIGEDEVFRTWLLDLKNLALSILEKTNKAKMSLLKPSPPSDYVNFVTAWRYELDDRKNEHWELLGIVDLNRIPILEDKRDEIGKSANT